MNSPPHDFVTVDMRGLKGALVARARTERVSVSVVVRRAVERELGLSDSAVEAKESTTQAPAAGSTVKLSIRVTAQEAEQLAADAKKAALSRGAFLAAMLAGLHATTTVFGSRPDCMAALTASNAELSALARSINHLTALLGQGDVQAAREYRCLLDTLGDTVRAHLRLAGGVLAELRPFRAAQRRDERPDRRSTRGRSV